MRSLSKSISEKVKKYKFPSLSRLRSQFFNVDACVFRACARLVAAFTSLHTCTSLHFYASVSFHIPAAKLRQHTTVPGDETRNICP